MKAMLFAAGKGTRLQPLTNEKPKCLVVAGGRTLLEHNILALKVAGVSEIILNTHHFSAQVIDFVNQHDFGVPVHISVEDDLLQQGGGLLRVAEHLQDEPFLVCNSDIYSEIDLDALMAEHLRTGGIATLAVAQRETARYLRFDDSGHLCGWENQKTGESISWNDATYTTSAFNGIQVMSPEIFAYMEGRGPIFSTIPVYLDAAKAGGQINAFAMDDKFWIDIGTIEKLEILREYLKTE